MVRLPEQKQWVHNGEIYGYELHIGGVRRINLRIRPDGSIRLSVPHATTSRQIHAFLARYADHIVSVVERNKSRRRFAPDTSPEDQNA